MAQLALSNSLRVVVHSNQRRTLQLIARGDIEDKIISSLFSFTHYNMPLRIRTCANLSANFIFFNCFIASQWIFRQDLDKIILQIDEENQLKRNILQYT